MYTIICFLGRISHLKYVRPRERERERERERDRQTDRQIEAEREVKLNKNRFQAQFLQNYQGPLLMS